MSKGLKISIGANVVLVIILAFVLTKDIDFKQVNSVEKVKADVLIPTHYDQRATLFANLPVTKDDVVMLGDSMILYNEWDEQFSNMNVINRGIGGDTTTGLLKRLSEVTEGHPKEIVLMIGTNDLGMRIPEEQILENYLLILQRIKQEAPDTKVIMTSVLPINKTIRKTHVENKQIISLNRQLTKLAKDQEISMVQLYDLFLKGQQLDAQYTSDGLHLNGKGYTLWVENLQKYVMN